MKEDIGCSRDAGPESESFLLLAPIANDIPQVLQSLVPSRLNDGIKDAGTPNCRCPVNLSRASAPFWPEADAARQWCGELHHRHACLYDRWQKHSGLESLRAENQFPRHRRSVDRHIWSGHDRRHAEVLWLSVGEKKASLLKGWRGQNQT
jgi:hypothetical protein